MNELLRIAEVTSLLLGDWSLRWALLVLPLAVWFCVCAPRRSSLRYLLCMAALVAGLLVPLTPRWGQGFWTARQAPSESAPPPVMAEMPRPNNDAAPNIDEATRLANPTESSMAGAIPSRLSAEPPSA